MDFLTLTLDISWWKWVPPEVFSSKVSPKCSLQTYQVSGRNLKKWKKNLEVKNVWYRKSPHWLPFISLFFWDFHNWKKSRSHTTFLFHFPVAKALKKNIFDKFLIFMWYFGGGRQRGGANGFIMDFSDFAVEYFRKEVSSSWEFFCQMFCQLSAICLPSLKQKAQRTRKKSGGPKSVQFVKLL